MFVEVKLNPGDVLINEGEPSDCIYILHSGELRVSKFKDGHPIDLGFIKAGEIVGEISFLDNLSRSATVKAQTSCVVKMMNRAHFNEIIKDAHPLLQSLIINLASRLRKTSSKLKI
jgi:CRP-like cAMP-binding protein